MSMQQISKLKHPRIWPRKHSRTTELQFPILCEQLQQSLSQPYCYYWPSTCTSNAENPVPFAPVSNHSRNMTMKQLPLRVSYQQFNTSSRPITKTLRAPPNLWQIIFQNQPPISQQPVMQHQNKKLKCYPSPTVVSWAIKRRNNSVFQNDILNDFLI